MKENLFRESEVVAFLEGLIKSGNATESEEQMYEEYQWEGKLNKEKYKEVYLKLLREMKDIYENGFK